MWYVNIKDMFPIKCNCEVTKFPGVRSELKQLLVLKTLKAYAD